MRYSRITFMFLCFYASSSFGLEIITSSETKALEEIEQKYNIDSLLISANDKLSTHKKKESDYHALSVEIKSKKTEYDHVISKLPAKILSRSNINAYYQDIEKLVLKIDQLETKYDIDGKSLRREYKTIMAEYDAINTKRTDKDEQLAALKSDITKRLIADVSKPDTVQTVDLDGSTLCSKFQSINDCLKDSENYIVTNTIKTDPFLNDRSVLLSYDVIDASMNMSGNLNYKIKMAFKPSYNSKIDSLINEKLGLKSAMITLVSNVAADWFIDGVKIGTGRELFHEVPLGQHGILASYQSQDKSSVEFIQGNGVFNYNFNNMSRQNDLVSLPNKDSKKQVIKMKPKQVNTNNQANATSKKSLTDKGYEYFMGIEPANSEHEKNFD
ncbi:hypothetical protein ACFL6Z_05780 [Pseudomonadota bacterium]|uniref:hypothetical protein n=1 Tax=unclassified Shewanella TaxID=196818 RepID=UPI000C848BF5|nr:MULTISPECIES: hypothetical protein [unclassified Shewanella]MDO6620430.1 hypothetical protein [Shewanella sp. 6_MG-2023]MDO6640094.1 hypothetical protein [Shewanella sp. 5_MG-2023]MDO6679710.1 hypothetical protein [Shewanella sp. 4_MG-2023]MDO6774970.1 hypothetical protein [Shewanella sp. 3_MG-2023]PMH99911.1 hypothetical protein BCU55_12730 [Shewanella sp. 10N.286.48.A6]